MIRPLRDIVRLVLPAILLALAAACALAQTNTAMPGQQTLLGVESVPGTSYNWDLYIDNTSVNFATLPGNCPVSDAYFVSGNSSPTVTVMWVNPGTYYFRVIAVDAQGCQNLKMGMMKVLDCEPPAVTFVPCYNGVTSVEAQPFRLTGGLPLNGTWSGGTWVNNPSAGMFNPQAAPAGLVPVTYHYTNAAGCSDSATGQIMVYPATGAFTCGTDPWNDVRDGKNYRTVLIGTQCWLADNLDYGTQVPSTLVQTDNCTAEKYCYNNDAANCASTGALYQWDELMQYDRTPGSQGICPPGWHVPEATEWAALINFLGGNGLAGTPLKDPVTPGFNALTGGVLYQNNTWSFKGLATLFWTSTQAGSEKVVSRGMNNVDQSVSYYESLRANAFPLRCLKDN